MTIMFIAPEFLISLGTLSLHIVEMAPPGHEIVSVIFRNTPNTSEDPSTVVHSVDRSIDYSPKWLSFAFNNKALIG